MVADGAALPPRIPAPGSMLRSHPCVALSPAQVRLVYRTHRWSSRKKIAGKAPAEYNWICPAYRPLAGFEVSLVGRFSSVPRGLMHRFAKRTPQVGLFEASDLE